MMTALAHPADIGARGLGPERYSDCPDKLVYRSDQLVRKAESQQDRDRD